MDHVFLVSFVDDPTPDDRERLHLTHVVGELGRTRLWVSAGPPLVVGRALQPALDSGRVWSAALLPELPDPERRWLVTEWRGALVVDKSLVELVGGLDAWEAEIVLDYFVLRPRKREPGPDHAGRGAVEVDGPREYQATLRRPEPAVAHADLSEVQQHLAAWFGELADPRVGGAVALLALSGAAEGSDQILLRNPVALGLTFEERDDSLPAHVRTGTIVATAIGTSDPRLTLSSWQEHRSEPSAEHASRAAWDAEVRPDRTTEWPSPYSVLLELTAPVDPEIVIGEGLVFEQASLNRVQTLATALPRRVRVNPGETVPVAVPTWCLNRRLAAPAGEPVRPTPLRLATTDRSQDEVWRRIDEFLQRSAG